MEPIAHPNQAAATNKTPSARRGVILGLVLIPLNVFWVTYMEMAGTSVHGGSTAGPYPTTFSLFANVICLLLALMLLNVFLQRRAPRWALSRPDLVTAYAMLVLSTAVASVDFMDVLVPMLGHPTRFATPENQWATKMHPLLPRWWGVWNAEVLNGWYEGASTPYTWRVLRAWGPAIGVWTAFIAVMLFTMLCLASLVRRSWMEHERLSYPIASVPLHLTDRNAAVFRSRALWIGFGITAAINLVNGINVLVPSFPRIYVRLTDLSPFFPFPPWNAIGWTPISFYPFAIGLGYLLPVDLLFSSWFFYFFYKAERVLSRALGWMQPGTGFPYVEQQCFGAYVVVALMALWGSRRYLGAVVAGVLGGKPMPGEEREPLRYRWALGGALGGYLLLSLFFVAGGLSPWLALAGFGIYFLVAFGITRMRAELGPPAHDLHNGGPDYILVGALGTQLIGSKNLAVLNYFWWFNRAYRSLPMPNQLEAFYIAGRMGYRPGKLVLPLMLAGVLGALCSFWAYLHFGYTLGARAQMAGHVVGFGWEAFGRLDSWLSTPTPANLPAARAIGFGAGLSLLLYWLRLRLAWWPFHPLGLALAGSWSMNTVWLPMLLAWVAKLLVLRYGGLRLHRRTLPFFLGLILGDFTVGCGWAVAGWAFQIPYYSFQQ